MWHYLRMDKQVQVKPIPCSEQNGIKMKKLANSGNIHWTIQLHMELFPGLLILFFLICKKKV